MSALLSVPFFVIAGLIGLVALALDPNLTANLALPHVVDAVMPPVLKALVIIGIISAVMSTADSYLNAAAISFVNDLVRPLWSSIITEHSALLLARLATLFIGLGAVIFALSVESILDTILIAYSYWAPVIALPLVATILGVRRSAQAFLVAAGAGVLSTVIWSGVLRNPYGIESPVFGTLVNGCVFILAPRPRKREEP